MRMEEGSQQAPGWDRGMWVMYLFSQMIIRTLLYFFASGISSYSHLFVLPDLEWWSFLLAGPLLFGARVIQCVIFILLVQWFAISTRLKSKSSSVILMNRWMQAKFMTPPLPVKNNIGDQFCPKCPTRLWMHTQANGCSVNDCLPQQDCLYRMSQNTQSQESRDDCLLYAVNFRIWSLEGTTATTNLVVRCHWTFPYISNSSYKTRPTRLA